MMVLIEAGPASRVVNDTGNETMHIPAELQLVAVSASAALLVGGSVSLFGVQPVAGALFQVGRFVMRRRRLMTMTLGILATSGVTLANLVGITPVG